MKAKGDFSGKICVVVGTITDDLRLYEVPALKVSPTAIGLRFDFLLARCREKPCSFPLMFGSVRDVGKLCWRENNSRNLLFVVQLVMLKRGRKICLGLAIYCKWAK